MISGQYVDRFAEANLGMLLGASLNAPYEFHWLWIKKIEGRTLVCTTREHGGREIRVPFTRGRLRDTAVVTVSDPIFGPRKFRLGPFKGRTV